MKKTLALILSIVLIVGCLAGCGQKTEDPKPTTAYVTNSVNRKLLAPAHELTEILEKYNSDLRQDSRAQWATVIDDATAVLERLGMQVDSLNDGPLTLVVDTDQL